MIARGASWLHLNCITYKKGITRNGLVSELERPGVSLRKPPFDRWGSHGPKRQRALTMATCSLSGEIETSVPCSLVQWLSGYVLSLSPAPEPGTVNEHLEAYQWCCCLPTPTKLKGGVLDAYPLACAFFFCSFSKGRRQLTRGWRSRRNVLGVQTLNIHQEGENQP